MKPYLTYETEVAHVKHAEVEQEKDAEHPQKLHDSRKHISTFVVADSNVYVDQVHLHSYEKLTLQIQKHDGIR